jgi:hypothetical protein
MHSCMYVCLGYHRVRKSASGVTCQTIKFPLIVQFEIKRMRQYAGDCVLSYVEKRKININNNNNNNDKQ